MIVSVRRRRIPIVVAKLAVLLCFASASCAPGPQEPAADPVPSPQPAQQSSNAERDPDTPNTRYYTEEGRAAAISAFEESDRGSWQKTDEILAALGLEPGMTVADIGAGSGYFTRSLAPLVAPDGKVVAVDIIPEFLDELEERARAAGIDNIETVVSEPDDPRLPTDSVDLVFVGDAYHHFDDPTAMLEGLREALRPSGRMAIVDWERQPNPRFEESGLDWETHIRLDSDGVIAEVSRHGFRLIERHDFLEWQYFLIFEPTET